MIIASIVACVVVWSVLAGIGLLFYFIAKKVG